MALLNTLNSLTTFGTFGCLSFSLSGMGVKLGKYSSNPHVLGFKYISESLKKDELYDAIIKEGAPSWASSKEALEKWCKGHQKSTRHWEKASQYCLVKNTVWHKLIENSVKLKENIPKTVTEKGTEECTQEVLNLFADDEKHLNFLIGKKLCFEAPADTQRAPASN